MRFGVQTIQLAEQGRSCKIWEGKGQTGYNLARTSCCTHLVTAGSYPQRLQVLGRNPSILTYCPRALSEGVRYAASMPNWCVFGYIP